MKMEVRPITREEYTQSCKAESVCFDIGLDFSKEDVSDNPNESYKIRRGVIVDGKLVSCLDLFPFKALLNGKEVGMSGVGGVVTLPEERHKGYVRELFKYCLKESYDRGDTVSYLYPFSNVYYRQFGYEMSMTKNKITVPTADFAKYRNHDTIKFYDPDHDADCIRSIYKTFSTGKNGMIVRSDKEWKRKIHDNSYKDRRYTYIHYNAENAADAYVILSPKNESTIKAEEMAWCSIDALKGILGFIYNYAGKYENFEYIAPTFINFRHFIDEPYDIRIENQCFGMMRIVNAVKAFETLDLTNTKNDIVIKVLDDFLSWNNATFHIKNNNGIPEVKKANDTPDMVCDVRILAQIFSGYIGIDEAVKLGLVRVNNNSKPLSKIFKETVPCIYDEF